MPRPLYVSTFLSRAGLGNMLFPWARAEVFAHTHRMPMLAPRWVQLKIGPLLRREKDKRYYIGLFSGRSYVRGVRKWSALALGQKVSEDQHAQTLERLAAGWADHPTLLFHFEGMKDEFAPFQDHRDLVRRRLYEITSARVKRQLAAVPNEPFIGIHVRRGDVTITGLLDYGQPFPADLRHRALPLPWYIHTLRSVRAALGRPLPARVFSDGSASELQALLQEPNVTYMPPQLAITDILLLARSSVVITSGTSTFSKWACFLGGMPSVYYPALKACLSPVWPYPAVETDLQGRLSTDAAGTLQAVPVAQ